MGRGPNFTVIPGDWANLEYIISDLCSRILNEDTSFTDYILKDGTRAYTGTGAGFKDEDDMASDSAVATASQQSIKAFVSSQYAFKTITGITNDVVADQTGDTLTLASGNNILGIVGTSATDTITFAIDQSNITGTGALNSGSITSGFGSIDVGDDAITTTGLGTFGNLIIADAGFIGSVSDTDAIQIEADGDVVISQDLTVTKILVVSGDTFLGNGPTDLINIHGQTILGDGGVADGTAIGVDGSISQFGTAVATFGSTVAAALTIGTGSAGVDYILTFNGENNDGVITWMEDEDYFSIADDVVMSQDLTAVGTITGGTLTDGTATLTGGNLTNIGTIGASGDADLLTLSDGQLTIAGNLTVGSTALDVDSTNMTVGIGTAALPDTLLKVQRTGGVTTDQEGLSFVPLYSVAAANLDFVAAKFAGQLIDSDGFDVDNLFGAKIKLFTATSFNADLTNAYGIYSEMNFGTSGRSASTITTARHINLLNATTPGVATITTLTGLYIEEQTTGDTNWQIYSAGGNTHFGSGTHEFIGTTKLGDGGSNLTQFSATGVLTMVGTARVVKHLHFTMELGKGQNAPAERFTEDPYVSYTYGIGDDSHLSREAPDDMDYAEDSIIKVHWYTTDATANGDGDEVRWEVQWASQAVGEDITAGDTTANSGDIVCSVANIIVETSVDTVPANSIAANDMIGIHIERVILGAGNGPQVNTVHIIDVELQYISNKLGEAA